MNAYSRSYVSTDETIEDVNKFAREKRFVEKGDFLINLVSMPVANHGMVNTLRVSEVE